MVVLVLSLIRIGTTGSRGSSATPEPDDVEIMASDVVEEEVPNDIDNGVEGVDDGMVEAVVAVETVQGAAGVDGGRRGSAPALGTALSRHCTEDVGDEDDGVVIDGGPAAAAARASL